MPAPMTDASVWFATDFGRLLETRPQQITALVRIDASGSWSNFTSNFTTLLSTVFAFRRGTKKTSAFTVASRIGPFESVNPLTHSGKILSLIMTSSRLLIMSPSEVSSRKRMARSGDANSCATSGATFSLNSSSFRREPIFKIEGKTCAASCPGNRCASRSCGSTCLVCIWRGTLSSIPGRPSKKESFSSVDLMCSCARKDMTRTAGCCWK
mmetsp:Transcript_72752/g.187718  ORF Transcript_72752/g.187718 Transcript_72752/m.187718 type:complete len:211 (-) Transcript_72752:272-904(-)